MGCGRSAGRQSRWRRSRLGLAHGDLSAYNLLVHRGELVTIDVPQVVDVIGNPRGRDFLDRDAENVGRWFTARGLRMDTGHDRGPGDLAAYLREEARLT
jgi:serine/threonine-protein kinase RIO1